MSTFLGYQSFLIPLGSTVLNCHTTIRGALTAAGWQIVHDNTLLAIQALVGNPFNASYPVTKAYDWTYGNCLVIPSAMPLYTGIKLVNSTQITQVQVCGSIDTPARCPKNFTIDYSDDGSAWTTAATFTNQTNWYTYERRYFNVPPVGNHVYWRMNVTAHNGDGSWLGICGLYFMDQYGNMATTKPTAVSPTTYFDCIPPSSESVGDSNTRELIRFEFSSTTIGIRPMAQTLQGTPQMVNVYSATAGNVRAGFTLGSSAVQQDLGTMSAGNTSVQNLRYLYDAVKSSVDPVITNWNWEYSNPATQNGHDTTEYIIGRCTSVPAPGTYNTPAELTITGSNTTVFTTGMVTQPGFTPFYEPYYSSGRVQTITIDLINGFIYYLQISSRGLAMATKTNTSYYGPLHACYGDHSIALAAKPVLRYPYDATIIELVTGYDNAATNALTSVGYTSHIWSLSADGPIVSNMGTWSLNNSNWGGHTFNRGNMREKIQDFCMTHDAIDAYTPPMTLCGSNIFTSDSVTGYSFQIHRVSNQGLCTINNNPNFNGNYFCLVCPQINLTDWYKFRGTATNEALLLVADTIIYTPLTTAIPASVASPSTIDLTSTAGFNSQGFVAINDEIFSYTGISGNSLTGISRAQYGSVKRSAYSGDSVYQCLWFTIINGGALLCGYVKPS